MNRLIRGVLRQLTPGGWGLVVVAVVLLSIAARVAMAAEPGPPGCDVPSAASIGVFGRGVAVGVAGTLAVIFGLALAAWVAMRGAVLAALGSRLF